MISNSQHALLDLKTRFENAFTNLPISVISHNMAILEAEEHPIAFEFITNTLIDLKRLQISTFISKIEGTIPGIIILDCGNVISQHINIICEYEILTLTQHSIEKLLLEPNPILTYSEWLLEAIENEILVMEVTTDKQQRIDLPVGIKNAAFL